MAQWLGQFSGNTHLSKVKDREEQLRQAVDAYRAGATPEERAAHGKTVVRLAERLLEARVRAVKARLAALDPRDEQGRELGERKLAQITEAGRDAVLAEFDPREVLSDGL